MTNDTRLTDHESNLIVLCILLSAITLKEWADDVDVCVSLSSSNSVSSTEESLNSVLRSVPRSEHQAKTVFAC